MTEPPAPRYRVIEEGRRLVVVDRLTGAPPARTPPAAAPSLFARAETVRFDGGAILVTHPYYDAKGPRTLRLDPTSARIVGLARAGAVALIVATVAAVVAWPVLLVGVIVVASGSGKASVRTKLRDAVTRWLDTVEREAG